MGTTPKQAKEALTHYIWTISLDTKIAQDLAKFAVHTKAHGLTNLRLSGCWVPKCRRKPLLLKTKGQGILDPLGQTLPRDCRSSCHSSVYRMNVRVAVFFSWDDLSNKIVACCSLHTMIAYIETRLACISLYPRSTSSLLYASKQLSSTISIISIHNTYIPCRIVLAIGLLSGRGPTEGQKFCVIDCDRSYRDQLPPWFLIENHGSGTCHVVGQWFMVERTVVETARFSFLSWNNLTDLLPEAMLPKVSDRPIGIQP